MAKGVKIELTERQIKWLSVHFKNTKNSEIAERLGISETAVHRYARIYGLVKTRAFRKSTQLNAAARARESHLRNGTYPPKGYKIPRSDEFQFKPGVTNLERLGKRREKARIEKSAESRRKTYKTEKARVMFGLEQKTKMRVICQPHYIACQRNYLRKLGYIIERGSMIAYYTPETRRSELYETRTKEESRRYNRYVAFEFRPAI